MTRLSADLDESAQLRHDLDAYTRINVDDGQHLICSHASDCRSSLRTHSLVEGQASHVGSHYAATVDGRRLRILVVPKQVGGSLDHGGDRGHEHVNVNRRSQQVDSAKYGPRPHPRTDHMVGTELALQVLLGLPAAGPATVQLDGSVTHVFDFMAMANMTLCSKVGSDSAGQGSARMIDNCSAHLQHTIELLTPNVIVAQGYSAKGRSPSSAVADVLDCELPAKNTFVEAHAAHGLVAFVAAEHPARRWFAPSMPAWHEVDRALQGARESAVGQPVPPT